MLRCTLFTLLISIGSFTWANELEIEQKSFFNELQNAVRMRSELPNLQQFSECSDKRHSCQTGHELFVQALDEMLFSGVLSPAKAFNLLDQQMQKPISQFHKVHMLYSFQESVPKLWEKYSELLDSPEFDQRTQEYIESFEKQPQQNWTDRYDIARALLTEEPDIQSYWDGRYYLKPRLFMFCRDDRKQTCLMLMKDALGRLVRNHDGSLWTHVALGYSRHKKDFYQTNGNTPSGVFRIDGVMPEADQKMVFGKYRRLILNFVGYSKSEVNQKKLLPAMTHKHSWWREAVTARNNGRGLFRIHGTGLRSNSNKTYFPLVPTSGCVAKRENKYNKVRYKDQRLLLDRLMMSLGFDPIYENETRISGLIYIIDIDKKDEAVTLTDLKANGILN